VAEHFLLRCEVSVQSVGDAFIAFKVNVH